MRANSHSQHAALESQEETGPKAHASAQAAQELPPARVCVAFQAVSWKALLLGWKQTERTVSSGFCFGSQVICIFYFLAVALGSIISILQLSSGYI